MIWSLKAPAGSRSARRRPAGWIAPLAAAAVTAALLLASAFGPGSRPETPHGDYGQAASAAADRSLGAR